MNRQSRFDAGYRKLGAGALGWPRGMVWGGRWDGGSGWGTCVHLWRMHVDVWQNQYNIVKLKKKKNQFNSVTLSCTTLCDPMNCSTSGFHVLHHQMFLNKSLTTKKKNFPLSIFSSTKLSFPDQIFKNWTLNFHILYYSKQHYHIS